ncbi:Uncharacterized protein dnm_023060 [Desulfonema magnum]|uniref:Uncharacterized protein n=1 Tax=Desulfonema magnum TaxID=45655 RepID=A0A975BJ42_9BACT|nr:Uncharacterized protein dnm_023060 [Desulfonema magnum]
MADIYDTFFLADIYDTFFHLQRDRTSWLSRYFAALDGISNHH